MPLESFADRARDFEGVAAAGQRHMIDARLHAVGIPSATDPVGLHASVRWESARASLHCSNDSPLRR